MSEGQAAGSTLLTEASPAAVVDNPAGSLTAPPLNAAPKNGADAAVQAAIDGPPDYVPAKFWDPDKKQAKYEEMGRSYINLEKLLGREKVPVPLGDDDKDGWERWYAATGRPEDPDKYEFERPALPDGMPYDEDAEKSLRQWAHANGLNKRQTKNLYDNYAKLQIERHAAWHQHQQQAKAETLAKLQREHGAQFDNAMVSARTVMQQYGDPEFRQYLDESGLGNDPRLIRIFARIGKDVTGETKLKGAPAETAQPADLEVAIANFRKQHHAALMERSHPEHDLRVREYTALFERRYGQ
jgi:hypothetical protein